MLWFYLWRGRRIATFLFMHNSNFAHQKHSLKLEKYGFVTKKHIRYAYFRSFCDNSDGSSAKKPFICSCTSCSSSIVRSCSRLAKNDAFPMMT